MIAMKLIYVVGFPLGNFVKDDDDSFGINEDDEENEGEALLKFTRDKNSKKHDFIPRRTRKINTERGVVKTPSDKKKHGNTLFSNKM